MPLVDFFSRPRTVPVVYLVTPRLGAVDAAAVGACVGLVQETAVVTRIHGSRRWVVADVVRGCSPQEFVAMRRRTLARRRCACGETREAELRLVDDGDGGRICFRCAAERLEHADRAFQRGG